MSAEVISAIRTVWPRHTSKIMSRKWGKAVVTMKLWLKQGVPEYQMQMILADLEDELDKTIEELLAKREALKGARIEKATGGGGPAGAVRRHDPSMVRETTET